MIPLKIWFCALTPLLVEFGSPVLKAVSMVAKVNEKTRQTFVGRTENPVHWGQFCFCFYVYEYGLSISPLLCQSRLLLDGGLLGCGIPKIASRTL